MVSPDSPISRFIGLLNEFRVRLNGSYVAHWIFCRDSAHDTERVHLSYLPAETEGMNAILPVDLLSGKERRKYLRLDVDVTRAGAVDRRFRIPTGSRGLDRTTGTTNSTEKPPTPDASYPCAWRTGNGGLSNIALDMSMNDQPDPNLNAWATIVELAHQLAIPPHKIPPMRRPKQ